MTASAASLPFTPTKDAMVKEFSPTTNFGTDPQLLANGNSGFRKSIFVQFTVSGIPAGSTGITAQLKLRSQTTGTGRAVTAHAVSNTTWIESGTGSITWSNQPSLGTALSTVSSHTAGVDSIWDVSAHVTGNGPFTIGLDSTYSGDTAFSSREGANAPVLLVSYTPPAPSVSFNATDWNAAEAGSATATIQVVSSAPAPAGGLAVKYTISGSAESNDNANPAPDYILVPANGTATTGTVTIPAGATTATLTLTPIQDTLFEGNETAIFTLATDPAYTIGAVRTAQVIIADNEPVPTVNPDHAVGDAGGWIVPVSGTLPNSSCSGMASSRQYPGVIWYQRDGTTQLDDPREKIYAIEVSNGTNNGQVIKTIDVLKPAGWSGPWVNHQWEDMAIDPDDPTQLWIGDIGNKVGPRTDIVLFKLTEPNPYGSATSVTPTAYYARYPGGIASNAEVLFVFEGLPHIILKETNPRIYRAPTTTLSTDINNPTILEFVGNVVSGGDTHSVGSLSADRRRIVLSTHGAMWVFVSQSALDPVNNQLTPAQAKTYIQDLLCTRAPVWALKHNGGITDPEAQAASVEGGCFVGDSYDVLFGAQGQNWNVLFLPASWYETQAAPFPVPPDAPTVNNRAPDVTLFGPTAGAVFSKGSTSTITLQSVAADADGTISNVKFYQKLSTAGTRTLIGTGTFASGYYKIAWNISGAATGSYTLTADATDNSGGVTSAAVSITINP